jgi:cytidylate kinase
VGGGTRSGLRVQPDADTEELAQIDYRSPGHGAVLLSATAKLEYAEKLAAAEQLLAEAHRLADGLLPAKPNQHARTDGDVGKIKEDLAGIANVLKDRALHVVLDGKSVDEELHHQQLHELVNAAAAHAEIVLGRGSTTGATALEHVLEEVRDSAEQHPSTSSSSSRREQVLRKLVAQEANRKKHSNMDLAIIRRDNRTGQRSAGGLQHLTPAEVLQETEEALERSGDYVQPLHAATDVALPTETTAFKRSGLGQAVHKPLASNGGAPGLGVHARDGKRTQREEEAQWKKDLEMVGSPDLLKTRDRSDVLSMEGKADENEALKTDISALVGIRP